MEKEKIVGYILLATGLAIIAFAAVNVFNVFYNKANPVDLFNFAPISIDLSKAVDLPLPAKEDASQELVSADLLNKPMNIFAHLILMGFIVTVGFRIASLGAMLIRPVKVNLKEEGPARDPKTSTVPPWK